MIPGDIIPYLQLCQEEGCNLQRGMNYKLNPLYSVILMSVRPGAPYNDEISDDGKILIYEGHDISKTTEGQNPKRIDQPEKTKNGRLTQNGLFHKAAQQYKVTKHPEIVRVYEKIKAGIWVYNGFFNLIDSSYEKSGQRYVFKFMLELTSKGPVAKDKIDLSHDRLIPSDVKVKVWQRDHGQCIRCGASDNLHFDHIIPFSKGGSSKVVSNIQLLCARHNLQKRTRIE